MTINVDDIASQVRLALDEAEARLASLRADRDDLNAAIKEQVEAIAKIKRLHKAVTPRSQNGDDE